MKYFTFVFHTKSLDLNVYFALTAHLSWDEPYFHVAGGYHIRECRFRLCIEENSFYRKSWYDLSRHWRGRLRREKVSLSYVFMVNRGKEEILISPNKRESVIIDQWLFVYTWREINGWCLKCKCGDMPHP